MNDAGKVPAPIRTNNVFVQKELLSYNSTFAQYLVMCDCYDTYYKDFDAFIFRQRESYLACILLDGTLRHRAFPIMLGSNIDLQIRRRCGQPITQSQHCVFGAFIIVGGLKIIPNFITNNLRGGSAYHVRQANVYEYRMTLAHAQLVMKLHMTEAGVINVVYEDEALRSEKLTERCSESNRKRKFVPRQEYTMAAEHKPWLQHLNDCAPIPCPGVTEQDYIAFFLDAIKHSPKLDDLQNKTIVSPTTQLKRGLKFLEDNFSAKEAFLTKSKSLFVDGNLYMILSSASKSSKKVSAEFKRSVYQDVDGEKTTSVSTAVSIIQRYVTNSAKNSNALRYPQDGDHFLCPISIKELVGAGEMLYFAQLAISAPSVSVTQVQELLDHNASLAPTPGALRVVLECFLTPYYVRFDQVLDLKRKLPFVLYRQAGAYLVLSYKGHTPVKYSPKYATFMSPWEAQHLCPDAFEDMSLYARFSVMGQRLPDYFAHAPSQKLAVVLTNCRGASAQLNDEFLAKLFVNHVGVNAALVHATGASQVAMSFSGSPQDTITLPAEGDPLQYLDLAIVENAPPMPPTLVRLQQAAASVKPRSTPFEYHGVALNEIFKQADLDHMMNLIKDALPCCRYLLTSSMRDPTAKEACTRYVSSAETGSKWIESLLTQPWDGVKNCLTELDASMRIGNQFVLYAMYADLKGGTNEDGVIIDSKLAQHGPQHLTVSTFVVTFCDARDEGQKKLTLKGNHLTYTAINTVVDTCILFGVLESDHPLIVKRSKAVIIYAAHVGGAYRYYVATNDLGVHPKTVSSYFQGQDVRMSFHSLHPLGVGDKIANMHGQKDIISAVEDLSHYVGYTLDGRAVHPQILFSPTSLIGRTTVSQVQSMLCDPEVAFMPDGRFMGRLSFVLHNIDPGSKLRLGDLKLDLMTRENGCLANSMSATASTMVNQRETQRPHEMWPTLSTLFNLFKLKGLNFKFR